MVDSIDKMHFSKLVLFSKGSFPLQELQTGVRSGEHLQKSPRIQSFQSFYFCCGEGSDNNVQLTKMKTNSSYWA